jgi:hypothetical protein
MPSDCTSPAHCCLLLPAAASCCRAAANWGRVPALHSAPVQLSVTGAALAPTVLTAHDEAASAADDAAAVAEGQLRLLLRCCCGSPQRNAPVQLSGERAAQAPTVHTAHDEAAAAADDVAAAAVSRSSCQLLLPYSCCPCGCLCCATAHCSVAQLPSRR